MATGGTPEATIAKLNADINAVIREPEFAKRFAAFGYDMVGGSAADVREISQRGHRALPQAHGGRRHRAAVTKRLRAHAFPSPLAGEGARAEAIAERARVRGPLRKKFSGDNPSPGSRSDSLRAIHPLPQGERGESVLHVINSTCNEHRYAAIFSNSAISTSGQVMCGLWLASISLVLQPSRRARSRNWRKRSSGGWRVA